MTGILSAFSGGSYGAPPSNTVAPAVTGTATFGQTLSTTNGTWTAAPPITGYTYQWYRSPSTAINGATSSTYVLVAGDVGNTIYCVVTATNAISSVSANSNTTATVAAAVPDAPTIGTATATGSTTATVSFTAPANNGGAAITSYTAISSPGSITGTLSQAGSGTITVSGLSGGTSYTFTVYATNSAGNSSSSSASNSITTSYQIGQAFGGGYYAGQISTAGNGIADYNLVIGPYSTAKSVKAWATSDNYGANFVNAAGTTSDINGPSNTTAAYNLDGLNGGSGIVNYPAAVWAKGLSVGGYSDWYLPAFNELEVCFYNLKASSVNNDTNTGINPNSVPKRSSNHTTGTPSQTSAASFQTGGSEAFNNGYFYSSTQANRYRAKMIYFNTGFYTTGYKTSGQHVRAVRRVAV
jgi:hypothetical protein